MVERNNVRVVASLVAALCVVTMFAGVGSAQVGVIDQDLDGELSESGGSGSGTVGLDAGEQGGFEGTGAAGGDVQEQEVEILVEGGGQLPNGATPPTVMVDCTLSPDTASAGLTEACTTTPLNPGALKNPEPEVALAETLVRGMIQDPESAPDILGLLLLLVGVGETVPVDQVPWEQIPWEQIPNDQIPVEEFPELSEQIPWEQIPSDEVPLDQPDIDEELAT